MVTRRRRFAGDGTDARNGVPVGLGDQTDLLLGQHLGLEVDPEPAGHRRGDLAPVAGEEQQPADAQRAQGLEGSGHLGSERVGKRDHAQEAVAPGVGAMAAILGLEQAAVAEACAAAAAETGAVVSPANLNGGGQVVIAGKKEAVDRACELAKAKGAKRALPLAVSAPFHCALMQPAADRLAAELARVEIAPLRVPVVTNVEAKPERDPARLKELLVKQVTAPVDWEESVQAIASDGIARALELGSGAVLRGLVKRIAESIDVTTIGEPHEVEAFS